MIKYWVFYFLTGMALCFTSCKALRTSGDVSLVQTDLRKYNLKGSVKQIDGYILHNIPDSLEKEKIKNIVLRNDCQRKTLNIAFDTLGFANEGSSSLDSLDSLDLIGIKFSSGSSYKINIDYSDLNSKMKILGANRQDYPCYFPNKVRPNYIFESNNPNRDNNNILTFYFEYKYKTGINGKINEIREYMNGTPITYSEYDLYITRHNTYNKDNLLVCQKLLLKEKQKNRLFESVDLNGMDVSVDARVYYDFSYDSLNRLSTAKLYQNSRIIWSETYTYRDSSMGLYKLDRFIIAARTFGKHLTNNTTEWYNGYGDITKSVNYDNEGNVVRTRFYEYDYDKLNNWIQCRMYLMGGPEKTEKPTLVAYRKIEYYPDGTAKDK